MFHKPLKKEMVDNKCYAEKTVKRKKANGETERNSTISINDSMTPYRIKCHLFDRGLLHDANINNKQNIPLFVSKLFFMKWIIR